MWTFILYFIIFNSVKDKKLVQQTVITCMETLKKSYEDEDAMSSIVLGTESGSVFILDPAGSSILVHCKLQVRKSTVLCTQ